MIEPADTYYKTAVALWKRGMDTEAIRKHICRRDITEAVIERWINWHLDQKAFTHG